MKRRFSVLLSSVPRATTSTSRIKSSRDSPAVVYIRVEILTPSGMTDTSSRTDIKTCLAKAEIATTRLNSKAGRARASELFSLPPRKTECLDSPALIVTCELTKLTSPERSKMACAGGGGHW